MSAAPRPPAFDPMSIEGGVNTGYPEPFRALVAGRYKRRLGDAHGLTNFGVNMVTLAPGGRSAARHWHTRQDEFVYIVAGEITLVTDAGEQVLGPGMAACFPAGRQDAHVLVNNTATPAHYLEVGDRTDGDEVEYPDDDLARRMIDGKPAFCRKDGTPY
ncbi:MAG: cupin domain-containing protein [Alphaproteobacteria bacterium]